MKNINLADLLICSDATLNNENIKFLEADKNIKGLKIAISKSEGIKCSHCWKILTKKCERKNCGIS